MTDTILKGDRYDTTFERGKVWMRSLLWQDSSGVAIDPTGYLFKLTLTLYGNLILYLDGGLSPVITPADGSIAVLYTAPTTPTPPALPTPGETTIDLTITADQTAKLTEPAYNWCLSTIPPPLPSGQVPFDPLNPPATALERELWTMDSVFSAKKPG